MDKEHVIQTHTHMHTHTEEYYIEIKKNKILSFLMTWMDVEDTVLSEVNQRMIPYGFTYIWNL